MLLMIEPSESQRGRMTASALSRPLWFSAPLDAAAGGLTMARSYAEYFRRAANSAKKSPFLVFNVSSTEAFLSFFPSPGLRWISLHQWRPPALAGKLRTMLYRRVLAKSQVIATYSRLDEAALMERFPEKPVRWIGHFVDTSFFTPAPPSLGTEPYALCVGDHLRLESTLQELSSKLGLRIIRVTSEPKVRAYYESSGPSGVELRFGVSFEELRTFYNEASLVINAVDDRYWPVGITSFCEALAMNCNIVTSGNHSCSGYDNENSIFQKVNDIFDTSEWIERSEAALRQRKGTRSSGCRELALQHCSLEAMSKSWSEIIGLANR